MCISWVVLLCLVLSLNHSCPALVTALPAPSYLTPNASTSWTNSLSAPDSVKFDDGSFARIILVSGSSDEVYGACGCGFYCEQTSCNTHLFAIFSLSYKSVQISKSDSPKVLWSANPSINATTLQLSSKKGLVLKDANGITVWSTNIGSKSVTGLNLTDMCNLQLLDDKSATIWQSYDHPVNTLFVGQKLVVGQQLTSLGGLFSLHVTRQGFFAYINSIPPQRYFTLAVNNIRYVQFLKDRLYIFSDVSSSLVIPSTNFSTRYMRLGADNGHLKVFDIHWGEVYDVFKTNITSCGFPRVCGHYGICTDGQCTCPRPINATRYFQPIEESQPDRGCSLITPLSCDASKNHILLELHNITYFPFTQDPPSINPDLQHVNLDSCKQACLKNCSCKAAFYNSSKSLGNCYLLSQIFSLMSIDQDNTHLKVYIKVQNVQNVSSSDLPRQQKNHKKDKQIIVASSLGSLLVMLLLIGIFALLFWKKKNADETEEYYTLKLCNFPMASITSEIASSSSLLKWEYEVFLSFRGEDTRNNFTDHLYAALDQKGIWTFRDEERLERGTTISTELLNAIEKSKFAIIVLSRDYASSSWCLDELVKIVECKEKTRLTVLPVFHGVDPSDVRHQRGSFAEAFAKHEELIKNEEKLQSWRAALTQVANLSGWDTRNEKESTIIEEIAGELIDGLHYSYSSDHEYLVGIQSRVKEMENLCLSMGLNDVHFIGIWGMGGIGKTTIAQVLYDRIRCHFARSSFLANVREKSGNGGLVTLQKQLLSDVLFEKNIDFWDVRQGINLISNRLCHKKVLVILDDVDQHEQLEALADKQGWFGQGSVIIIITRDKHLLIRHEVAEEKIYEPEILDNDEALKLFSLKAFKQDNPLEGYEVLSKEFVYYARGLPLALKVLGSSVFHRDPKAWESVLGRLRECPERKVLDVLQISYDGLKTTEQKIFLDIACFFKGMTKHRVVNILQTSHYKPYIDIDVLVEKSLITILDGEVLEMHDLLRELGMEIVRGESCEPGRRSRLWDKEDVLNVLKNNTGTKRVEGIFINTRFFKEDLNIEEKVQDLNAETFSKMRNLRLLKICNVGLPQGLNSLSSDLRLMDWPECPLKFMPKNFNPDKLVVLIMPRSLIKQLWEGNWSLEWLRIVDLRDSRELIVTLDFARVPNLEELILNGCTKLSMIHASLGDLKRLILLDLKNCKCLESLPGKISWKSLKKFILSGCSKLKKFPEIVGNMSRLQELYLDETAIEDLPLSMEQLTGLIKLDLTNCKKLSSLPRVIFSLASLNTLTLSGCSKLHKMQENLGNLKGLKELDMSGTGIRDLPLSMEQLSGLIKLDLTNCKNLSSLPGVICSLTSLNTLTLSGCSKLHNMQENLGNLKGLKELDMSGTGIRDLPLSTEQLLGLIKLDLTNCKNLSSLPGAICSLTSLKTLTLSGCLKLDNMPMNLGNLEGLEELDVSGTAIREPPSSIFCLKNLKILSFQGCNGVSSKSWSWKNLLMRKTPDLMGLVLPSVSGLTALTRLNIRNCNLQAIPSDIGCLYSLEELDLSGNNFVCLPESINQLSNLDRFWVENCKSLQLLPVLQSDPRILVWANGCTSLETLLPLKIERDIHLYLLNCFQLVENQGRCDLFTTMLREHFQGSILKERLDVVIPGSEVPNWFRHQSVGASINLEVPSYLFKQFRGIALCAVFEPYQCRPPCPFRNYTLLLSCNFKANGNSYGIVPCVNFWEKSDTDTAESDHRWFMYLLPNFFINFNFKGLLQIADGSSCQLEIEFKNSHPGTIKKCGAHVVCEEEMEDLKQSMDQTECSIIRYNEGVDHFEEDIKIKRSRDDENGGGSGEGSSTHIPHPKTKRVRSSDGE